MRNLLKCNSDFRKKSCLQQLWNEQAKHYVALSLQCGCVIPAAERLDSSAVGIVQLVAHEVGESIVCVRGGYTAIHKLLW